MPRTLAPSIYNESPSQLIAQSNIIVNYLHKNNMRDNRPRNQNIYNY